jgi:hypothetical protein
MTTRSPRMNVARAELRELLESNLVALHALLEEQQRVLHYTTRVIAGLRADVRALSDVRAPWVKALSDTRALLYVALHEVVTTGAVPDAHDTLAFEQVVDPHAA